MPAFMGLVFLACFPAAHPAEQKECGDGGDSHDRIRFITRFSTRNPATKGDRPALPPG